MGSELIGSYEIPRAFDDTTLSWARRRRAEQLKIRTFADSHIQAPDSLSIKIRRAVIFTIFLFDRSKIRAPREHEARIVEVGGFAPSVLWNDALKIFGDESMNDLDLDPFGL